MEVWWELADDCVRRCHTPEEEHTGCTASGGSRQDEERKAGDEERGEREKRRAGALPRTPLGEMISPRPPQGEQAGENILEKVAAGRDALTKEGKTRGAGSSPPKIRGGRSHRKTPVRPTSHSSRTVLGPGGHPDAAETSVRLPVGSGGPWRVICPDDVLSGRLALASRRFCSGRNRQIVARRP